MSVNNTLVNGRTLPFNMAATANGSYTLPQHVFIPGQNTTPVGSGMINGPQNGAPAHFAAPYQLQRPYPLPDQPNVYGIRVMNVKSSPG